MGRSKRTQERYAASWKSQSFLETFGFTSLSIAKARDPPSTSMEMPPSNKSIESTPRRCATPPAATVPSVRSASELSEPSDEEDELPDVEEAANEGQEGYNESDWEEEIEDEIQGSVEVRDWEVLRKVIKNEIQKKSKILPLSSVNKLMILANFATLRLRGHSQIAASIAIADQWYHGKGEGVWFARRVRALARHYQVFEMLPIEKKEGNSNQRSWLQNESVQVHARQWLSMQETGKVTPRQFRNALNSTIFPSLNILPKRPLSERTARRWLLKLGWRYSRIGKGVYMDGHEREDVVKYRKEVFLPAMAQFEARMA